MLQEMPVPPTTDEFSKRLESQLSSRHAPSAARSSPSAPPRPASPGTDEFTRRLAAVAARARRPAARTTDARPPQAPGAPPGSGAPAGKPDAAPPAANDALPVERDAPLSERGARPVGDGQYLVREIDCLSRIAAEHGLLPDTIWNDPANAALRQARPNRELLYPGDRVFIPPLRSKREPGAAEMRHRFRRKGMPSSITLVLKHNDQPRANEPYRLEIDGAVFEGVTDAQGQITRPVPPGATRGRLRIGDDPRTHEIEIGRLDPIDAISGVQQRLNNLGFACGPADGVLGPRTRLALTAFQQKVGIEPTGRADDVTRQRLVEQHGS